MVGLEVSELSDNQRVTGQLRINWLLRVQQTIGCG